MTDRKHNQEITTGLPKKKWFTLEEIAARWSELTGQAVTVDDVLHYEEIGEIRIAALIAQLLVKCPSAIDESYTRELEDKYAGAREARTEVINRKYRLLSGIIYPFVKIAPQIREGNTVKFCFVFSSEEEILSSDFVYTVAKRDYGLSSFAGEEIYSESIPRDALRITRIERDRFEQKHGIGKPAPMPKINEETELKRTQRALGALAIQIANEKPRLMNGTAPNVLQIAEYAIQAVSNAEGKAPHGYGCATIRDALTVAIDTVNKDLANL